MLVCGAAIITQRCRSGNSPSIVQRPRVDGAEVGCRHVVQDGGEAEGIGWVAKQDRRHSFPDPQQRWPAVAASLDGDHTVEQLRTRFELDDEALDVLARLHGLGFVAYV